MCLVYRYIVSQILPCHLVNVGCSYLWSSLTEVQFLSSQSESFGKIISQLAAQEGVTEDKIMLSLSDINILGYDTPISTRLSVADIIGEFPHGYQFVVKQDQLDCH